MRITLEAIVAVAAISTIFVPLAAAENGWIELFDGKTLDGWHNPYEWGESTVVDGEIHLKADKKFFLVSDRRFGDFIFEAEVKLPEGQGNSGFMFRCHEEKNRVYGYQAEVDPSNRKWAGGLYDEGRRKWLNPLTGQPEKQAAFKPMQWNHYRIECRGDHIQIFVNGVQTTDYRDPLDVAGPVALQHHGEKGKVYRFRNVRIKDLGRHEWKPIFNGSDLTGWRAMPGGTWEVRDGVLVGTSPKDEKRHGLLLSHYKYDDFTVRAKFKVDAGNSGFYFRATPVDDAVGVKGFQAEADRTEATGGLYETLGRGWVVKPDPNLMKKAYKPGEWTDLAVSAHGGRIVVHINGQKAVELMDDPGSREGHFALQLHGKQDMHVEFKDIEILQKAE